MIKKYALLLLGFILFCSHDMYLKLDTFFLSPLTPATIKLYNGTFHNSENVIDRNRMIDVSLMGNGKRIHPDTTQWSEQDSITLLSFETGEAGTWVAGVSTRPRSIALAAADFNSYLEHDGVVDMLEWRKANNAMEEDAVERYSKHVKAIFQVGDELSEDWKKPLDYPIEFVPLSNPYHLHTDAPLQVQLLWQGEPLADQLVYANHVHSDHGHSHYHTDDATHAHEHDHNNGEDHQHNDGLQLRTDKDGIVALESLEEGIWYLRTIYLTTIDEPGLTHESNWATLTFEVGSSHSHGEEGHTHTHGEEPMGGIPSYVYWLASLVLLVGLFWWFNRKNAV
jgi:uncharacterized GH25 family protein